VKRKDYFRKRALYLKKRAAKYAGHAAPMSVPVQPRQLIIHNGHATAAQLRAVAAVTDNQL